MHRNRVFADITAHNVWSLDIPQSSIPPRPQPVTWQGRLLEGPSISGVAGTGLSPEPSGCWDPEERNSEDTGPCRLAWGQIWALAPEPES